MTSYTTLGNPGRSDNFKKEGDPEPLKHPYVLELAQKYKKDPAQVYSERLIKKQFCLDPYSTNAPAWNRSNSEKFESGAYSLE